MSEYDSKGLYEFLTQTPEQGLRKMLVDNKPMTEAHFNLLIKVIRGVNETDFAQLFDKAEFPKIKFGPAEQKIKEKFWADCIVTFKARGILQPSVTQKAA